MCNYTCMYEETGLKPCETQALDCENCEYNLVNQIKSVTLSDEQFKFHFPTKNPEELAMISQEYITNAIENQDVNDLYNYYYWLTHKYKDEESCDADWNLMFIN